MSQPPSKREMIKFETGMLREMHNQSRQYNLIGASV